MNIKKIIKNTAFSLKNGLCYSYYYKCEPDNNSAVFTSRNGADLDGNMLGLISELKRQTTGIKIYVAATDARRDFIRSLLTAASVNDAEIVKYDSVKYFKCLETAKYLFCDSTLPIRFIKRKEQIYVNTWHGTPLKKMGNDSLSDRYNIANVQKNFLSSDYLVFPSDYCRDKIMGSYNISDIYQGTVLMTGYPRNDVFFSGKGTDNKNPDAAGKKVYAYLPTFRENAGERLNIKQNEYLKDMLKELDSLLNDNEIFYVKLHVFVENSIDFSEFSHIKRFPQNTDTYSFLNSSDLLITDYSSVFYDFANSGKKIIRFVYDEQEYTEDRGMYEQPAELPFPKVYNVPELVKELRSGKNYEDRDFLEYYCTYDKGDAASKVIKAVLSGEKLNSEKTHENPDYIYNESIDPEGRFIWKDKRFYNGERDSACLVFCKQSLIGHSEYYNNIPDNVSGVIGFSDRFHPTFTEQCAYLLYHKQGRCSKYITKKLDRFFQREAVRLFTGFSFNKYVFLKGKNLKTAELLTFAGKENAIYITGELVRKMNDSEIRRILGSYREWIIENESVENLLKKHYNKMYDSKKIVLLNKE